MAINSGPDGIVQDGLISYVDPANKVSYPGSGTEITDLIGTNNGTISGTTFTNVDAGAWDFDGIDDRVYYSTGLNLTTSIGSYSIWVKKSDITTGGSAIITGNNGYRTYFNIATPPGGKVSCRFSITHQVRWTIETDNVVLSNNVWTHIALVHNGTEAKIYIDGVAVSQSFGYHTPGWERKNEWWSAMSPTPDRTRLAFFQIPGYSSSHWAGTITNVQIYNKALSAAEVLQNYNALKRRFT